MTENPYYPPGFDDSVLEEGPSLDELPEEYRTVSYELIGYVGADVDNRHRVYEANGDDAQLLAKEAEKAVEKFQFEQLDALADPDDDY